MVEYYVPCDALGIVYAGRIEELDVSPQVGRVRGDGGFGEARFEYGGLEEPIDEGPEGAD